MKIYVVGVGCYSDYNEVGAFSTRRGADRLTTYYDDTECVYVKELELDTLVDKYPEGRQLFCVGMSRNGDYSSADTSDPTCFEPTSTFSDHDKSVWIRGAPRMTRETYCWARDKEHAIKIANDRRREAIIRGEWSE